MFEATTNRYNHSLDELLPLQLQAIQERFDEQRSTNSVLAHRADKLKIERLTDLADVVPLLFAHTLYKSYPESFLNNGRWDKMTSWVNTLSSAKVGAVDLSDVQDIDGWMARLWESGNYITSSSGTSGKCSFLNLTTEFERDAAVTDFIRLVGDIAGVAARSDRAAFLLGPSRGLPRMVHFLHRFAEAFGRPDAHYFLSDAPLTTVGLSRMVNLARAMAEGRATPSDIAENEAHAKQTQERSAKELDSLIDAVLKHREEPSVFVGFPFLYWMIMQNLQARGIERLDLHNDTVLAISGGLKRASLPEDYQEQLTRFFNVEPSKVVRGYSQTEITGGMWPFCAARRYHCPPWVVLFILDESGEILLNPTEGMVNGRVASFDTLTSSHWGGIVSGDNVDADFSPCDCGRPGPTITNIARYSDLQGGDDKLTCSGSMDTYVRGIVE
ncbi:MAG: hypothetical protein ACRDTV_05020 [Mycobacterium sp.]